MLELELRVLQYYSKARYVLLRIAHNSLFGKYQVFKTFIEVASPSLDLECIMFEHLSFRAIDLFKEQEIADYRQAFKPSIFNIALAHEWYGVQGKQIGEFRRIKRNQARSSIADWVRATKEVQICKRLILLSTPCNSRRYHIFFTAYF